MPFIRHKELAVPGFINFQEDAKFACEAMRVICKTGLSDDYYGVCEKKSYDRNASLERKLHCVLSAQTELLLNLNEKQAEDIRLKKLAEKFKEKGFITHEGKLYDLPIIDKTVKLEQNMLDISRNAYARYMVKHDFLWPNIPAYVPKIQTYSSRMQKYSS